VDIRAAALARLERLPAHCGGSCGMLFERWVKPRDAELDLVRFARLN
jgi:hypothetical protein